MAGGASFDENRLGAVAGKVRDFLGTGRRWRRIAHGTKFSLAPYLMLLAALPLVLLLVRLSR